ncbi:MAG: B-4DMT family transporter [Mycobacterium sp.]|uniref:B-4DMT family transporter n=1 Tax=Mycobacterium sp. TaxID=1785 RepID=UPI003C44A4C7
MRDWMLRGLVFAGAMVVLRLVQGALINAWQTQSGLISIVLLLLFIIGVVLWGLRDGRTDANANRDPDRRQDLAMTWLLAGLVAGILSGAVSWLIAQFYTAIYTGGLLNEVTTFAAFTALIVFVPGIIGVAVGRWRVDRQYEKEPEKHHGLAGGPERAADTDVFSAVRGDDAPTGEIPVEKGAPARTEQRTAVATAERGAEPGAEREAPTETIATGASEAPTESFKLPGGPWGSSSGSEDKTDAIRTHDADQTKPDTPKKD